jgi:hypothetical protein
MERAVLTQDYLVYLVVDDADVTVPAGAEFMLYGQVRDNYLGVYEHPKYGEITVDTPHAVRIAPLAPGMFILHGNR